MTPAQVSLILLIVNIIALPFALGALRPRADQASDDLIDRLQHGDVRLADVLNPPHGESL